MNIDMIAKLKSGEEFFTAFQEGDQLKTYDGVSLIFFAVSNKNLDARHKISNFLLDKGIDVRCLNRDHESVLHVLLSQVKNDIIQVTHLCERLIKMGADINVLDKKNRSVLKHILNMKHTDDELKPLYDLWFSQKDLVLTIKDDWGLTPIDFAKNLPYRKNILERMEANVKREES
ncbi:ankyrin repeat protein [Paenibacillus polymyxa]|uniref:ankyrin repeat domain-containing protein n=1 Tax=Paenibacillus polymyxa TaxID=1406 RepID=UPI00279373D5|nr:ankyrin repeat domain-containing protein [Paenibacillus polymyxa]MDQ0049240.1 ankyrin repeat protein [Paenibacillus polymyxa]